MAIGKDKEDDQFDGVAEGIANPDEDEAPQEKEDSKAKESGKGRADKAKQDDADEDQSFGKKDKGARK